VYVSAILIAGGRVRRPGTPGSPGGKSGRSGLTATADVLLRTCADEVVVVLGKRASEAATDLKPAPRLRIVADPDHAERDRDLLRVGLESASPEATAYVVHRTDSAPLSPGTIDRLLSHFLRGGRPIAVVVNGVGLDHPVFLSRALRDELLEPGDEGWLRALIARDPSRFLVLRVDTRGAVRLIDGPGVRPPLHAPRASE
jgi:CTP:molybdopterin cytidylyltransferase MocA